MLPADKCYVSSSGNDDNSGADDLSALATVNEAVTRLNNAHVAEKPYIINVTGEISFSKIIELNSALLPCNITIDGGGSITFSSIAVSGKIPVTAAYVSGNAAGSNGGGVYTVGISPIDPFITDSYIGYNRSGENGGAIYKAGTGNLSVVSNVGDMIISNNEAASGSGGGIYFTGTGDFTVSSADISNNTADVMGGGIVVFNGSSGTYNFSGIMNDNRSPNGAAVSFGANLSAVATFDLVMNGYTYNLDKQSPVVFVDADNAGLTLNILPNTMITDGEGTQNAGFIYLTHPAKITISEQLNKKITLDPSDYSEYYTSPILDNPNGVDISTTIYLVDWEDYGINQTSGYIYEK
jgi:predicted outer membrane repeat protein